MQKAQQLFSNRCGIDFDHASPFLQARMLNRCVKETTYRSSICCFHFLKWAPKVVQIFVTGFLPSLCWIFSAVIKDPSNQNHVVRSLPLDLRDLRNEGFYPSPVLQQILSHVVQNASVATEQIAVAVGQYEFQVPGVTPWFNEYLQRLINLLEPCEHEFLKHYLACKFLNKWFNVSRYFLLFPLK